MYNSNYKSTYFIIIALWAVFPAFGVSAAVDTLLSNNRGKAVVFIV